MATSKVSTILSFPSQAPSTISSQQISKYAEVTSILAELEKTQKGLRSELLALNASGALQESGCPYLLNFVAADRRNIDWKALALHLAQKLNGAEGSATWQQQIESSAPMQPITQIRVRPNPVFAAGSAKPVAHSLIQ